MKKIKISFILALVLVKFNLVSSQVCKEIIGYYPNWQWYDRNKLVKPSTIMYNKYSILNYCFFKPESNGIISNTDPWADENLLLGQINWSTNPISYYPNTSIIDLAHNAGKLVMVSIGGWTLSDNFPSIAANPTLRAKFASECVRLIKFYKFDGIDIDWEYPGYAAHSGTPADKINFTLLLQQVKDSLTSLSSITNKYYKLSACVTADINKMADVEWNNVSNILDMINLMSYDFFGAWDCYANHNAPLYSSLSGDPTFNVNNAFTKLTTFYNVPSTKINIGLAFYGRTQMGATNIYQTTNCTPNTAFFFDDQGTPLYYNVIKNMSSFNKYWDNATKTPYLLGKSNLQTAGTFVSYDDKQSIGEKANYINNFNARGAIIWEITGDYIESSPGSGAISSTPLIDTLNSVFCSNVVTNVNELRNVANFSIYPNPANSEIFIDFIELDNKPYTIELLNIVGQVLYKETGLSRNFKHKIQDLHKGIYFVNVTIDVQTKVVKIIKE